MADVDLIACLYPYEDFRHEAFAVVLDDANKNRYIPPVKDIRCKCSPGRECTEPLEAEMPSYSYGPGLALRFSQKPRTSHGFVFGTEDNADIVLPRLPGISNYHFALTFDEQYRPIVKDLDTPTGTEVTYGIRNGAKGRGRRRRFVWIIGGADVPRNQEVIAINVGNRLKFQVVVTNHDLHSQLYIDSVNAFWQGTTDADNLFDRLDMRPDPAIEPRSGIRRPGTGPIFIERELGQGSFGQVHHFWNVSTGDEFAMKQPTALAIRKNRVNIADWIKETRLMSQISHPHIVKFLGVQFTPTPRFRLEYIRGGSLDSYNGITAEEGTQVLSQCLSALAYLHGRKPPIVHRDIKPNNILVDYRTGGGGILVKFADFGLSRASADPTTICGTPQFFAPELFAEAESRRARRSARSYTPAVDIWSLGVTVFDRVNGLPSGSSQDVSWCRNIVQKLRDDQQAAPHELKQFLLNNMVIMEPEKRRSAQECARLVKDCFKMPDDCGLTPSQASVARIDNEEPKLAQGAQSLDWPSTIPGTESGSVGPFPVSQLGQDNFPDSWPLNPMPALDGGASLTVMLPEASSPTSEAWATVRPPPPKTERTEPASSNPLISWMHAPEPAESGYTKKRKRSTSPPRSSLPSTGKRPSKKHRGQSPATRRSHNRRLSEHNGAEQHIPEDHGPNMPGPKTPGHLAVKAGASTVILCPGFSGRSVPDYQDHEQHSPDYSPQPLSGYYPDLDAVPKEQNGEDSCQYDGQYTWLPAPGDSGPLPRATVVFAEDAPAPGGSEEPKGEGQAVVHADGETREAAESLFLLCQGA